RFAGVNGKGTKPSILQSYTSLDDPLPFVYANLGMDLDYIIPFAGIPENGCEIDGLDDRSELAHRMMLVNLLFKKRVFINTTAGWVNLLLMSSSGPVKIPVGACATALQSLEITCDAVLSGKAKVMIAGGFDDISEEGSYEFANMKATSNAETEFAMGLYGGQGTGVHIIMNAKTALELGAPIRRILAFTSTST
ncbi:hypothetical protein H0H93_014104, partial [Arthromyces matolae]